MESKEKQEEISLAEAVNLGAVDSEFFNRYFLPKSFRDRSPLFHRDADSVLENPLNRYVNLEMFRGSSKTTKLRAFTLKRICYGISHTILYVGKGQKHALYSIEWLQKQIEYNTKLTTAFGLRKGKKWAGTEEIEIYHGIDQYPIRIAAYGITGQIRGVNIDDYRPDLIIMDDINDEENTATPEQRAKTEDLVHGALQNSLAPPTESPDAKMVNCCTPLNREDISQKNKQSRLWRNVTYGCFDENGRSRWEERFPTEWLNEQKQDAIDRNKLSVWLREMECKIISPETSAFLVDRLKYWDVLPDGMATFLAIDPVPPPSEKALQRGLRGNDYEVLAVIGFHRGNVYVCEYVAHRGHEADWTIAEFFRLLEKWNPLRVRVETVAYQRTLKGLLERECQRRRRYVTINSSDSTRRADHRKKAYRIEDGISGPLNQGKLYVNRSMGELIAQVAEYPDVSHDDVIEAVAEAINEGRNSPLILDGDFTTLPNEEDIPALPNWRVCR